MIFNGNGGTVAVIVVRSSELYCWARVLIVTIIHNLCGTLSNCTRIHCLWDLAKNPFAQLRLKLQFLFYFTQFGSRIESRWPSFGSRKEGGVGNRLEAAAEIDNQRVRCYSVLFDNCDLMMCQSVIVCCIWVVWRETSTTLGWENYISDGSGYCTIVWSCNGQGSKAPSSLVDHQVWRRPPSGCYYSLFEYL